MKKIVNGKRYDTDTAIRLWHASSSEAQNDFRFWEAALYVTPRSKSFFLAGRGGAMSGYARPTGQNSYCGGSDLVPLTDIEALEWLQEYQSEYQGPAHQVPYSDVEVIVAEYFSDLVADA